MAQNPEDHASAYGLSRDVLADLEDDEGAPSGGHHGETRTRASEHTHRVDRGSKTRARSKDIINGRL
jgi:hypothetical protein